MAYYVQRKPVYQLVLSMNPDTYLKDFEKTYHQQIFLLLQYKKVLLEEKTCLL